MKILHIVKTAVGAAWVYQQVRALRSFGFEIVVALPSASTGLAPKYKEAGATVIPLALDFPSHRPWQIPAVLQACKNLVKTIQPDIIHTHHVGTTFVARAALGKSSPIPRIFQVPGILHLEHPFYAHLDKFLAGPQDHWIAACRWTQHKYQSLGIPTDRVHLSYLGTDLNNFTSTRTGILRSELGVAPEGPLVGMVGYMYPPKRFLGQTAGLKGHEDFIAALQIARKKIPALRGVIIGGAWNGATRYENHLHDLGRRSCNGFLTFLGTRSDVPALYPDLDLLVLPSHTENVPFAVVESLLSAVPVVSTNVGGLPDLVQEGISGKLVPPRNPSALAAAIISSLQNRDESNRLASAGQKIARHLFDVDRTAREVAQIYSNLVSCPNTRHGTMPPIKILHVLGTLDPAGVGNWLMNLLKNLDTGKFKFDFCTFGSQPGLYASQAEKLGAEIFHCPHSANPLVLGHRFRQILRAHRYDVVHSHVHLFSGAVLRWARQERVAIRIAHSHTSRDAKPNTVARRAYRSTMKRLLRRHATHGLAVSGQAAGDLFLNWKNDPRIAILRYGIDLKPFQDAVDSNLLRAKMGLPMGAQVIGHVGNFVLAKNHVFFLEVAGEIRKLRPGIHFLLIGDGPLRKDIAARALAMDLQGCMHFLGTRTDVPLLLRACMDAFVFPSLWEGLPIAVIEAQAAGLPCVISGEITDEVIVLSDQVLQLPLALGAKEWARNIIQKIDHEKFDAQSSVETMLQKGFAIQRNLSSLLDLYSGAPHGNSSPC